MLIYKKKKKEKRAKYVNDIRHIPEICKIMF